MSQANLYMQGFTAAQGINSTTFCAPPFKDRLFSVPQLYDWHSVHSKDHPFFVYFDEHSGSKVTVLWKDAAKAVRSIAHLVSRSLENVDSGGAKPLVGLYSSSDILTYLLTFIGITYAGFPVFLISNRVAPVALEHLLAKSGVTHVFISHYDDPLAKNLQVVKNNLGIDLVVTRLPSSADILWKDLPVHTPSAEQYDPESIFVVFHSSGSTALPELNFWTHKMTYTPILQPWYGERDLCGQIMSTPSIPTAGAAGVMQALLPASGGMVISGFKPASPPTVPNPQNVWNITFSTGSQYCFILQPFLAVWSNDPEKVTALAGLEGVAFGGGPLPRAVGDNLAKKGVEIFTFFGSSEAGLINRVFPKKMGMDWEWFSFFPLLSPAFRTEPDEKAVELVLKSGVTHKPTRFNTEFDGVSAYATGDLLEPHPTIPELWRYVCRISDLETLGFSQKVNVVAFARVLMQDPLIAGAVLFSHTKGHSVFCGVVVEPDSKTKNEPLGLNNIGAYIDLIWPTLERYNNLVSETGRLTKERVIVSSSDKPFAYGEKGMPRRKEVIAMYHDEIQRLV